MAIFQAQPEIGRYPAQILHEVTQQRSAKIDERSQTRRTWKDVRNKCLSVTNALAYAQIPIREADVKAETKQGNESQGTQSVTPTRWQAMNRSTADERR